MLSQHPLVGTAAVSAVPDEVRGDEVAACVIPKGTLAIGQAQREAAEDIVQWCLARLAYYKVPGYVAFVRDIPLTSTQKIQRGALKAFALEAISGESCVDTRGLKKRQVP